MFYDDDTIFPGAHYGSIVIYYLCCDIQTSTSQMKAPDKTISKSCKWAPNISRRKKQNWI